MRETNSIWNARYWIELGALTMRVDINAHCTLKKMDSRTNGARLASTKNGLNGQASEPFKCNESYVPFIDRQ